MFQQELESLGQRLKGFRYQVLLSNPDAQWPGARGRLNSEFISRAVPEVNDPIFFLCGPPPFMDAVRTILAEFGVNPERIRRETFGGVGAGLTPALAPSNGGFLVEFARSGKAGAVPEGQTLLEAAVGSGVSIPSVCRQGQCGTCKTMLLAGKVRMTAENGLDPESKARGYILACVAHAEGDVKLDA
jgi:ferredoxin